MTPPIHSRRLRLVLGVVMLLSGFLSLQVRGDLIDFFPLTPTAALFIPLILLGYGAVILLWMYLRGELSLPFFDSMIKSEERLERVFVPEEPSLALRAELDQLQAEVRKALLEKSNVTQEDRTELLRFLREQLSGSLASDVEQELRAKIEESAKQAYVRALFRRHSEFLLREISALTRRANVNLLIGVITTLLAAGLLVYMVTTVATSFAGLQQMLEHYLPRISTVIFIEVFSFFFLKLYRSNLSEIKYYENELTNLVVHEASLETAVQSGDSQTLSKIAETFSHIDRNSQVPATPKRVVDDLKELSDIVERLGNIAIKATKNG